jgi:P27 family predicted phage terminase small subunit
MPTPRKPEDLHRLQSTQSQAAPEFAVAPGRPTFPKGLSSNARKAFKSLCRLLEQRRSLTAGDGELLRLWAVAFDRHQKALAKVAEQGEIRIYYRLDNHGEQVPSERPNLWLKVAQDSEKFMLNVLDRLGLTPLNRAKIKPTKVEEKSIDPFEELIMRRGNSSPVDLKTLPVEEEEIQ